MRSNKMTILIVLLIVMLLLSGCSSQQKPVQSVVPPHLMEMQQSDSVAKRFQESNPQTSSAVESAIELSERYARLSEEAAALRQQNQSTMAKNEQLNDQIVALKAQLQQVQKELNEANDLLIEMRIELNSWKNNILGFREEMREAQTAQLEALFKILGLLGGQVTVESANSGEVGSAVASVRHPNRP
jgi:predicted RNase H-like nuclease (RuvC/YqgF family)